MNIYAKTARFILIALVSLFTGVSLLFAQDDAGRAERIIINYAEVQENGASQLVDVYFTVVDSQNRVVADTQPQSARISTSEGVFTAAVQPATAPIYIVLALDISGSMGNAIGSVRSAAISAVNNAPDEAYISLITFNEEIVPLQGFTNDHNRVINAIGEVPQPTPRAGTCLYDAADTAMSLLDEAAADTARRAVILFTDGRDEVLSGAPCSQSTFDDVRSRARTVGEEVTIYTIGLGTSIDAGALENLANATGGLARFGGQAELGTLFQEIMEALDSQWLARAPVCVSSNVTAVTLEVDLGGGRMSEPAARSVEFTTDCVIATETPPPTLTPTPTLAPLEIGVDSVQYNVEQGTVTFEIVRQGDGDIATYRVQIYNRRTGILILEQNIAAEQVQAQDVTVALDEGVREVEIVVTALDVAGLRLAQSDERAFVLPTPQPSATPQPSPTPIPVEISLVNLQYDQSSDSLILTLDVQQQEQIRELEIFIDDDESGINRLRYSPAIASEIVLPIDRQLQPGRDYRIRIRAVTQDGEVLNEDTNFRYDPLITPTPTITPSPTATRTATPTPTLPPVSLAIASMEYDSTRDVLILTLDMQRADDVLDFEVVLVDSDTQRIVGRFSPPLAETVEISLADIPPLTTYTVRLNGRTTEGVRLGVPEEEFYYEPDLEPTNTPTATLAPAQVSIVSLEYNSDRDILVLTLDTVRPEDILDFEVVLVDSDTQRIAGRFSPPLDTIVEIPMTDIAPLRSYTVRLNGRTSAGERLTVPEVEFTYEPDLEPTATPTPPPTIALGAINIDEDGSALLIDLTPSGDITGYEVRIVDAETGVTAQEVRFATPPPDDQLRVPIEDLASGSYQILVTGTDANGETVSAAEVEITYTRPPDPTATPGPSIGEEVSEAVEENPALVGAIIFIALILLLLIVWAVRQVRRSGRRNEPPPLPDLTGVGESSGISQHPTGSSSGGSDYDPTIVDEMDDRTIVDEPLAYLFVVESPDRTKNNQRIEITRASFVIGRNSPNLDLDIQNDPRVSHRHATITLEGDRFFIRDENSGNGVMLEGARLVPGKPTEIENNQQIKLGHTTLRFESDDETLV